MINNNKNNISERKVRIRIIQIIIVIIIRATIKSTNSSMAAHQLSFGWLPGQKKAKPGVVFDPVLTNFLFFVLI